MKTDAPASTKHGRDPIHQQEAAYHLPYHWFPEERLQKFERQEKQHLIFDLITAHQAAPIQEYLDVGCGDGRWTADIYNFFKGKVEATGIDFSERAISFARLITPEINFEVHKGEELPYRSQSFDLVTAIEVIEHVEDGAEEAFLAECHRVLRPTGLFILTTPSWNLPLTAHHFRHYSIERLSSLLEAAQFNILDIRGQSIPWKGKKRKLRKIMSRTPKVWHLWKFTYRETRPEKALNLMVAARPINHSQL